MAKTLWSFDHSECIRVKSHGTHFFVVVSVLIMLRRWLSGTYLKFHTPGSKVHPDVYGIQSNVLNFMQKKMGGAFVLVYFPLFFSKKKAVS